MEFYGCYCVCVYTDTIPLLTKNYLAFTVSRYCARHLKDKKKTLFQSLTSRKSWLTKEDRIINS